MLKGNIDKKRTSKTGVHYFTGFTYSPCFQELNLHIAMYDLRNTFVKLKINVVLRALPNDHTGRVNNRRTCRT